MTWKRAIKRLQTVLELPSFLPNNNCIQTLKGAK